jgi:chromosome partitioning protein
MAVVQGLRQHLKTVVSGMVGGEMPAAWSPPPQQQVMPSRARVVAVCAQKGGVGKTTTAVHLAAGLASRQGLRVLVIDLDAQGHVASSLRAHLRSSAAQTVSQALLATEPDLQATAMPTTIEGLSITAADKGLSAAETQLAARMGREMTLARGLRTVRGLYDVVVLDCPPNLGLLTLNALFAADHLLVPCDLSVLALEGVDDLMRTLQNLQLMFGRAPQLLGLLHTRVDRRNPKQNTAIRRALQQSYQGLSLRTEIATNTALPGAQLQGQVVFAAAPESTGARDYAALADEVWERVRR